MSAFSRKKEWLHVAIFLIIIVLGWIVPPFAKMTPEGMKALALFIAAIYGWTASRRIWPSFLLFVALPFSGIMDARTLISSCFGGEPVVLLLLIFVLLGYMEETNVSSYMCYWLMTRKFAAGHPWRIVFTFLFASWAITVFSSNIYTGVLLVWGIFYAFADKLGYKPYDRYSNIMVFCIAIAGVLGSHTLPWASPVLTISGSYTNLTGNEVNLAEYLLYFIPFGIIGLFALVLMCKFVFKLDVSKMDVAGLDESYFTAEDKNLTSEKRTALLSMLAFLVLMLVPSFIPSGTWIREILDSMGMVNKVLLLFAVLSLIDLKGKPAFDFAKVAARGINWNVAMMVVSILGLSSLLSSPVTGISETLNYYFAGLSGLSGGAFIAILIVLCVVLTNFLSNTLVAIVLLLPAASVGANFGITEAQAFYILTLTCSFALMTPAAGAGAVIMFSNREWLETKTIMKYGLVTLIVLTFLALVYTLVFSII